MFAGYLVFVLCIGAVHGSHVLPETCTSYSRPGDVILGGIFPLRFDSHPLACTGPLSPWAVRLSEALIFAVEEINRRVDLLPNVTLGFDLRDDCRSEEVALWSTLSLIRNSSASFPEVRDCRTEFVGKVAGIVGTGFSETSISVAKTASLFHLPVVSYAASSDELSDKARYPYFLRTYPPDRVQVQVIVDLIVHFNWEYIGLVYSLESDGIRGAFRLQELAEENQICLAFSHPVREFASDDELRDLIDKLETYSKVDVVVLFGAMNEAQAVLGAVKEAGLRKITWIGTTHWGYQLAEGDLEAVANGALFIRDYRPRVQEFGDYFSRLDPSSHSVSPWFEEFAEGWLVTNNCSDLSECPLDRGNTEGLVINSVYAFAHAIDTLLRQNNSSEKRDENNIIEVDGPSLLKSLQDTQFEGPYGQVSFDSNGDGKGRYVLSNLQHSDGKYTMANVGWWDAFNESSLWLKDDLIKWPDDSSTPPKSSCREVCRPGYALIITLRHRCCSSCVKCPDNSIVVNDTLCLQCEYLYWPDEMSETCIPIIPSSFQLNDALVLTIVILTASGLLLCLLTGLGMVWKRGHRLVKATGRELTSIHFAGLIMSFIACLLLLTATPTSASCIATEAIISISFTMTYAPTLLKVIRIHRIFKMGRVSNRRPRFTSPRSQVVVLSIIIFIQSVTSILSALLGPSAPTVLYTLDMGNHSEIICAFGYGFLAPCSVNLFIIAACCCFAFLARKVPDNYNESTFIAVSVYTTLVLCLATMAVYTSSVRALPKVATISVVVMLNAYISLICLYMSKLIGILFERQVAPPRSVADQMQLQNVTVTSEVSTKTRRPILAWHNEGTEGRDVSGIMASLEPNRT